MDAMDLLMTRSSNGKLTEPGPDDSSLRRAFEAAARAPDHGALRPLRVRVVRGHARDALGTLMADVLAQRQPASTPEERDKMRQKALRAPMILVIGAALQASPKVPVIEQILCAGAAAHALLLALQAQGYAAIWRTGDAAYDAGVKRAFGFAESDAIVGFIYAGTAKQPAPALVRPAPETFVSEWLSDER
jgi:nitroreductase